MSTQEDIEKGFEWYDLNPGARFFDPLEKRFFINFTNRPLKVGFSHDMRRTEMIAITDGIKKDPELEALQDVEVVEE
jgi:hypothetical protein